MTVTSIYGGAVPQLAEPRESVISTLERLLERAQSGDVQAIAVASMDAQQLCSWTVAGAIGGYGLIGAVQMALCDLTMQGRGE